VLSGSALVVGEDPKVSGILRAEGMNVVSVRSMPEALSELEAVPFDVIVLDVDALSGAGSIDDLVKKFEEVPVVVATSEVAKAAVEAVRAGAADFVELPCDREAVTYVIGKVLASRVADAAPPQSEPSVSGLFGESKAMRHVLDVVRRVTAGGATVLIRGESGTGKELVARALHFESPRASGPFVKVTCAGIPEALLESELFGYEKGAFTGATSRKPGRVEIAEGGTVFLDEIGDVSPAMQVKLLRLLQDREYERLGGNQTLRADVRFLAATHRDLEHMIKKGEFREDLFYRLNVVPLWLPPLRARRDDIALLSSQFCDAFAKAHAKPGTTLSEDAIAVLSAERWPGNVRQLQNFVERLVVLTEKSTIEADDVRRELLPPVTFATQSPLTSGMPAPSSRQGPVSSVQPLDETMRVAERNAIERALRHAKGNRTLAARLLGVGRATLYVKLEEHGLAKRSG
jgi:two-component system, NtrC family, response regulator AtoC